MTEEEKKQIEDIKKDVESGKVDKFFRVSEHLTDLEKDKK